jgi:hypothetical protein
MTARVARKREAGVMRREAAVRQQWRAAYSGTPCASRRIIPLTRMSGLPDMRNRNTVRRARAGQTTGPAKPARSNAAALAAQIM